MVHAAVCDDDPKQLESTLEMLQRYMQQRPHIDFQYTAFSSGQGLLWAKNSTTFDLYLLDVLMPEFNGIETGLSLRDRGAEGVIIYLTSSRDYAIESYQTRAFFYLVKPVREQALFRILDQAVEQIDQKKKACLMIHTNTGQRRVLLDQILYVERAGRTMRCYCRDGEVVTSISLRTSLREAVQPLLEDKRFVLCGVSYVLNLRHIIAIEDHAARMDNGAQVPIPRQKSAGVMQAWMDYWLEENAL